MSILSVEVIDTENKKKDMNIFMGVGVIKAHLKQNMTQKANIKIIYTEQKVSEIRYTMLELL